MTSTNGPSARDSAGKRETASVDSQQARTQFLTVAEVAGMMRVSKMTVYRLVHNGELPAVRVGRSFRGVEGDVDEDLRNGSYNAGGAGSRSDWSGDPASSWGLQPPTRASFPGRPG